MLFRNYTYTIIYYGKNDFTKVSKNLDKYIFENNFADLIKIIISNLKV